MLKLSPAPIEPAWIDLLPDVRLQLRPPTVAMILAAREAAADVYRANIGAPEDEKDPAVTVMAGIAMNKRYARARIIGWEGISDEDGMPAEVTAENIDRAMEVIPFHDAFYRLVLAKAMHPTAEAA